MPYTPSSFWRPSLRPMVALAAMTLAVAVHGERLPARAATPYGDDSARVLGFRPSREPRLSGDFAPEIPAKPLGQVGLSTDPPPGRVPVDHSVQFVPPANETDLPPPATRGWGHAAAHWAPSEVFHQPLYFDEQPLERYGQTVSPIGQPILSGIHFFGMFPIMPYKIGIDRTHDRISTLAYYPVGTCAPPTRQRLPMERDAAFFESGAWIALIFILP